MKKTVLIFLIIFTLVFFVVHKYLIITSCNTYDLKIYENTLYIKYGIVSDENRPNKLMGSLFGCRRYKLTPLNLKQKLRLENHTILKRIGEDYYLKIPFEELFSDRPVTLIFKKIDAELGEENEN